MHRGLLPGGSFSCRSRIFNARAVFAVTRTRFPVANKWQMRLASRGFSGVYQQTSLDRLIFITYPAWKALAEGLGVGSNLALL